MSSTAETRAADKNALVRSSHAASSMTVHSPRVHVGNPPRRDRLTSQPTVERGLLRGFAERGLDIAFALSIGLALSPVLLVAVLALGFSDGPILFKQARLGRGGRLFHVYKFRTMVPDASEVLNDLLESNPELRAEWERDFKLKDDPRITTIGRFLRRTSLDELPQLWNIMSGDMSVVGPRPVVPSEIIRYGRFAKHYYAQRPGLTGLWQVSGRNDASYERRVVLDAFYSKNRSLGLDISIMLKTIRVVLKGSGAY
ncbi:sugar transferase [Nevskia ramosa]|uniref:sugar transferase n=1 Tax=Nevskia ramosa TaxID=64002 RepID=UPI003D11CDF5